MTAETKFHTDTADGDETIDRTGLVLTLLFALAIVLVNLSIFMVLWSHARHRAPAPQAQTSLDRAEPLTLETSSARWTLPAQGPMRSAPSAGSHDEPREARADEWSPRPAVGAGLRSTPLA